jgi:RHS repeat-associated protein
MCEVEPSSGRVLLHEPDFRLNGELPFVLARRYNNLSDDSGILGPGWTLDLDRRIEGPPDGLVLVDEEGRRIPLGRLEPGQIVPMPGAGLVLERGRSSYVVHTPGGVRSTYRPDPEAAGRLPLVRFDQTGRSSVWLRYHDGRLEHLRTTHGHKIQLTYDAAGRIESIDLGEGRGARPLVRYAYDPEGRLAQARDPQGGPIVYEYSGGLLVRRTNRLRGSAYLEYDERRRCTATMLDGPARTHRYDYDDRRRAVLVTDALGRRAVLRFHESSLLDRTVRFDGSVDQYVYLEGDRLMSVVGDGIPPSVVKRDGLRNVVQAIEPGGETSAWAYDEVGRMVEAVGPAGGITRFEYDDVNHLVRRVDEAEVEWLFGFDAQGRLAFRITPLGNRVRATRTSDGTTRLEDNLGWLLSAQFDDSGNVVRIDRPSGSRTRLEYDASGRLVVLTAGKNRTAKRQYDAEGHMVERVDPAGNATRYERDRFGLLLKRLEPTGRSISYEYDAERRLIAARSSTGAECRFVYDDRDRLIERTFGDGRTEKVRYDDQSGRSSVLECGGIETVTRYSPGGQLAGIRSGDHRAEFESDPMGRCIAAEADGHRVDRKYGGAGPPLAEVQDGFAIEYESDAAGLVTVRRDPSGRVTHYRYNVRGQLLEIDDSLFGVHRFERDQGGRKSIHILPNGIRRQFAYDEDDAIVRVVTSHPDGTTLRERTYGYNPIGEITRAETLGDGVETFDYDAGYRLLRRRPDRAAAEVFAYDPDGNLTAIDGRPSGFEQGRLRSSGSIRYDYDPGGRVITRSAGGAPVAFAYGRDGLIRQAILPSGDVYRYEYDAFARRVAKHGPGRDVRYYWDRDVPLMEVTTTAAGAEICAYLFLPGSFQPLGHHRAGRAFHYDLDRRSLIREVFDEAANEVARYHYRSFGGRQTVRCDRDEADPPFRLPGQYADPETGMHYNRSRYFDPEIGRFLAPAPDADGIHRGAYIYGPNPIGWSSPMGLGSPFGRARDDAWREAIEDAEGGLASDGERGLPGFGTTLGGAVETARTFDDAGPDEDPRIRGEDPGTPSGSSPRASGSHRL